MGNELRKHGSSKIHEPLLTPVEAPPTFKSRQAKTVPNVLFHNTFRLALQSLAGQQFLGMKVAQRAYLTYQVNATNAATVVDSVAKDKDFFMTYQITITNMGNTPAVLITPKINVIPDPDRPPLMITFPTNPFDLGPKESRTLTGQALFKHMRHVRQIPGFSTGFSGLIEYKDVFGDSGVNHVCYQLIFENSVSGGFCGSVIQQLEISDRGVHTNP